MFRGDANDARSRSGIVTLKVRPDTRRSTSLSIRISRVAVDPGGTAVVSGVLLGGGHPLADRRVILQRRPAGDASWHDAREPSAPGRTASWRSWSSRRRARTSGWCSCRIPTSVAAAAVS